VAEKHFVPLDSIKRDLNRLSELTNGLVARMSIMGGEPLLHPDLPEILKTARLAFPRTYIKIVTNGVLLLKQDDSFWKNCKENNIVLDITKYPINLDYNKVVNLANTHGVDWFFNENTGKEKKTLKKQYIDLNGRQDPRMSYLRCGVSECVTVTDGKIYPCPIIYNIKHFNNAFGQNIEPVEDDYRSLDDMSGLKDILEFLNTPKFFCRYCNVKKMTFGHTYERSTKNIEEWT
jgi:MoaA/NifB/PqqE/SkfB family radical SAM enzyme